MENKTDLSIIYLKEIKNLLPYRDTRSIYSWLTRFQVMVHGDLKRKFVLKVQFERAQLQEKIQFLKMKYGEDWINVLQSEMKVYSMYKSIIEGKQQQQKTPMPIKSCKSFGSLGTKFLKDVDKGLV